jgi:hypothetical protein
MAKIITTKPRKKSFESWIIDDIESEFGLERLDEMQALDQWLAAPINISDKDREQLLALRQHLRMNVDGWNEDELKFYFLGPLMFLIGFDGKRFKSFLQRSLKAVIGDIELSGKVDFMLATGKTVPKIPYFFFHEYKRKRGRNNDPLGQLLAEMLVAQVLNEHKGLLFGCYMLGEDWYFVVLDGKHYAISLAFDSNKDDIFNIVAILQQVKTYIHAILEATTSG